MLASPRILMFSRTDLTLQNGGTLCTVNLLENLMRYADVQLTLVTAAPPTAEVGHFELAQRLGIPHHFIPLRECAWLFVPNVRNVLHKKYYHLFEFFSKEQDHIDSCLLKLMTQLSPDLLIVDGIWSAACIPASLSSRQPYCFVTHNRELDIHRDILRYSWDVPFSCSAWEAVLLSMARRYNTIANFRFSRYVRRIYAGSTGVIALAPYDLSPAIPHGVKRIVLPPLLTDREQRWCYRGSRSLLFVGNANYFANRIAIEWLRDQLAPALNGLDRDVSINIIGAGPEFSAGTRHPNVNFLGKADREEVIRRITTEDLLIAPTAQLYGAKLKLAESAAHGMPFCATTSAMGGLPFLEFMPSITLRRPAEAARLILSYINDPKLLVELSSRMTEAIRKAHQEQALLWAPFILSLVRQPVRKAHVT